MTINCPKCTAGFSLMADVQNQSVFCPRCGEAFFVIDRDGVARSNPTRSSPQVKRRYLVPGGILALSVGLLFGAGLVVYLVGCGRASEQKPTVLKSDQNPEAPGLPQKPETPRAVAAVVVPAGQQPAPGQMNRQQWEYKIVALNVQFNFEKQADVYTERFNTLAKEGWEYHSTLIGPAGAVPGAYAIFQRPKQQ